MNLDDELRALGRSVVVPPVDSGLTDAVLQRVADLPVRKRLRDRWRVFFAGLLVVVAGVVLTPPVRAQVAEWLRIGGVQAQPVGTPPTGRPSVPAVSPGMSLKDAARVAGFTPALPKQLGTPTGVQASDGFVATSWSEVRLEQFRSGISPTYLKQYYSGLQYVEEVSGYWFETPHQLVLVNQQVVRIAGPTLVWERDGVTFRLEGVGRERAVELAGGTS
ncbi:hypothetical protein [Kribbella solani]|uniref:Uncharacterized protein n=1 Tax=Kribbella solani TaxID=236067 RepID=A0A841DTU9_9ACTN|nr:hypothetical protein [Kribbella solani]MBB5978758.1 hypothetical protein [Kribbella solani]